jgi:Cyclic-phosphate processing Receiver domain
MKLWIDDIRTPPDESWVWAKSSAEALAIIRKEMPEQIHWDFDLGGTDTVRPVLRYIEEMAIRGLAAPPMTFVHSQNPVGRDEIAASMMQAFRYWRRVLRRRHEASRSLADKPKDVSRET